MRATILLIDDEANVLRALQRTLYPEGYRILTAQSGSQALDLLARCEAAVIVCDQQMPGMCGAAVLQESMRIQPNAVRIMLTGGVDIRIAQASINEGRISHFLLKPWDDDQLRATVREAVYRFQADRQIQELHELTRRQRDELQRWNHELDLKVLERTAALTAAYEETLNALVFALDTREQATAGHSWRVTLYCMFLAMQIGFPRGRMEDLYRGALLHDIGKIGVPDSILLKAGKLTKEERRIIEQHVVIGGRLLERIAYLRPALSIPLYHHEWYDGSGYCARLTGEAIPLEARIFALVDVYDALRTERPYKKAFSHQHAVKVIASESAIHFDPALTGKFISLPESVWTTLAGMSKQVSSFEDALAATTSLAFRDDTHPTSTGQHVLLQSELEIPAV